MISVWPLESDGNVIHEDLIYSFLDMLYAGEGALKLTDLDVSADTNGIGVKVAPGGVIILYDSTPAGKRVFYNSVESKSGTNKHPNGSFATATTHWTAVSSATITRDTGTYYSSPAAGKIATSGASAFAQGMVSDWYRVNSSELQALLCWLNAPVGTTVRLMCTEADASFATHQDHQIDAVGTGAWQMVAIPVFTSRSDTKYMNTRILVSAAGSVNVFCDDFQINQNFDWIQGFEIADPTNPRLDRVVAQIKDKEIDDTVSYGKFTVISGTPTSGATLVNLTGAAAVPDNCYLIGNVLVPAAAASLSGGNIDNAIRSAVKLNVPEPIPRIDIADFPVASPIDNQVITLVIDTSTEWLLKYDLSSGYWRFLGGAPMVDEVLTSESCTSTSYGNLATVGPSITVPTAGEYVVGLGCHIDTDATTNIGYMSYNVNGGSASDANSAIAGAPLGLILLSAFFEDQATFATADLLRARYKGSGASSIKFRERRMTLKPIRLAG